MIDRIKLWLFICNFKIIGTFFAVYFIFFMFRLNLAAPKNLIFQELSFIFSLWVSRQEMNFCYMRPEFNFTFEPTEAF